MTRRPSNILRGLYSRNVPEEWQRAILVRRRQAIWLRTGLVFIHVPKVAGTSINEAVYGQFMGHIRASDLERWASRNVRMLPRVALTRNPWDRVVSAYRFEKGWGGAGIPEFETFETFVTHWLAVRDVTKLNFVHQPQWLYVCDKEENILVDHLGRLENLSATISYLQRVIPGNLSIGRSNASGAKIDYRRFYTSKLIDLVGDIYREDIRLFGYTFEGN